MLVKPVIADFIVMVFTTKSANKSPKVPIEAIIWFSVRDEISIPTEIKAAEIQIIAT